MYTTLRDRTTHFNLPSVSPLWVVNSTSIYSLWKFFFRVRGARWENERHPYHQMMKGPLCRQLDHKKFILPMFQLKRTYVSFLWLSCLQRKPFIVSWPQEQLRKLYNHNPTLRPSTIQGTECDFRAWFTSALNENCTPSCRLVVNAIRFSGVTGNCRGNKNGLEVKDSDVCLSKSKRLQRGSSLLCHALWAEYGLCSSIH